MALRDPIVWPSEVQVHTHNRLPFNWDDDDAWPGAPEPHEWKDKFDEDVTHDTGLSWVDVAGRNFSFSYFRNS